LFFIFCLFQILFFRRRVIDTIVDDPAAFRTPFQQPRSGIINPILSGGDALKLSSILSWINRWGPVLLFMAGIFYFSSLPGDKAEAVLVGIVGTTESAPIEALPQIVIDWYKVGHVIGYALLGAVTARALAREGRYNFWSALLICTAYAVTDEIHQYFVPNRHAWPVDVLLDAAAAGLSISLFSFFRKD